MAQLPRYDSQVQQVGRPTAQSTAGFQAAAQGATNLASRLASFSNQLSTVSTEMAKVEGANSALRDFNAMRQESQKIQMSNMSEEEKTQKLKELQSNSFTSSFGAYSNAYNNSMKAAYNNQIIVDASVAADLAIVESGGDAEQFLKMYQDFSQQTVKSAPDDATAMVAQQAFMKQGASTYRALMMSKSSASSKQQKETMKNAMDALGKQFSDAFYANDMVSAANIGAHMTANIDSAVANGLMTKAEGEVMLASYSNRAILDSVERGFNTDLNSNRGSDAYMKFIMNEKKGIYDTIPPEDVAKLKSSMMARIREHNDNILEADKFEKESTELIWEDTYRDGLKMAVDGSLKESQVIEWERTGVISKSLADDLRERISFIGSAKYSDQKTMSRYAESDVLVDTDPYMILNDQLISEKDKRELIARREQLLETRYNWTKTNDGREAIRRIKSKFNILEGTLLAKIDITNQTMQDFDTMYKEFYSKVTASPNPDLDVLDIADTLIKDYDKKKLDEERRQAEERKRLEAEAAKALAKEYNESIFVPWLKSPKTPEDFMLEK